MLQLPCMLVCSFVCANRTRDRGCSKHPVFPAPSDTEGGKFIQQTSGETRRENAMVCHLFKIESLSSSLRTQGPITTGRNCFVRSLLSVFSNNNSRGVWVPAFAGTTAIPSPWEAAERPSRRARSPAGHHLRDDGTRTPSLVTARPASISGSRISLW
jgi:hypothetical protein